jgi:hypothetical protein
LLVAALAARWLGSRAGLLAGLVQMTAASLLPGPAALPDALFCLVFSVALGAFLVAQVPGSPPLADRPALRILFFVAAVIACMLAGPVSMALIFAVCVCYLALSQDRRGSQFLYDRVGLGIFGLVAVAWLITVRWVGWSSAGLVDWACFQTLAGRNGLGAAAPAWGMAALRLSVFAPLALPAICSGLRNGHYATPFWRFLACWSLGPLVLLTVGRFRFDLHIGALLPPLAIVSAVGLESLLRSAWRSRRC